MKKVREINWDCRSKWSELKLNEYRYVSNQIKQEYQDLIKPNQMLDLESIEEFVEFERARLNETGPNNPKYFNHYSNSVGQVITEEDLNYKNKKGENNE